MNIIGNNVFVMAPIMPSINGLKFLEQSIVNLHLDLNLNLQLFDPLSDSHEHGSDFLKSWQLQVEQQISKGTNIFIGFSFGAVILNMILSKLNIKDLRIILISMPLPITGMLHKRLNKVLELCLADDVIGALKFLYKYVYAPKIVPANLFDSLELARAKKRLIKGFKLLFEIERLYHLPNDGWPKYLHLSGEKSQLVSNDNLLTHYNIKNIIVPESGMKVLDDNPLFCKKIIENYIENNDD